jgi:hypothetical protein
MGQEDVVAKQVKSVLWLEKCSSSSSPSQHQPGEPVSVPCAGDKRCVSQEGRVSEGRRVEEANTMSLLTVRSHFMC